MMNKTIILSFLLTLVASLFIFAAPAEAQNAQPTLLKRTINIQPRRFTRYWKTPKAAEPSFDAWSWTPKIEFQVLGQIPRGKEEDFYTVEFDTPEGKPWLSLKMFVPATTEESIETVRIDNSVKDDDLEKIATTKTGLFPFRIKFKGNGASETIFSGKVRIDTYQPDQKLEGFKGFRDFYVVEDWRLPMAWLWLNPVNNEDAPVLTAQMWLRGANNRTATEAQLFYNGKQIAEDEHNSENYVETLTSAADEQPYRYSLFGFSFAKVRGFAANAQAAANQPNAFFLNKNPGEYEIRILRDKQPARTIKFTVGSDGKIVDNGVTATNKIGGIRMIVPVKIHGTADGKFNPTAWQTDAFYGNPLAGFTVVQ